MLQPFGPSIWITDGFEAVVIGFRYPTRMAVIRLADGGLFIWSPVALTALLRVDVDALGHVAHVVAPNALHHLYLSDWQAAYPAARLHAAPGLRNRRRDIAFATELGDKPPAGWADDIDQVAVRGNLITTEIVFFHRASATMLFADLLQQFSPGWFGGWRALVARLDGTMASEPRVPHKFRCTFVNRTSARTALRRIVAWPAQRLLAAHAPPVTADVQTLVARAFAWLRP
ncbi:MAG: DUF4336 domain-containing protein [Polymorphobacter sp.]